MCCPFLFRSLPDVPVVVLDDLFADGEPETGSLDGAEYRIAYLPVFFKDIVGILWAKTNAGVGDAHDHPVAWEKT